MYFISPTLANIRRVSEDLQKGLYESFHVNFSEPLPRSLLEELAASVARDGTEDLISEVRSLSFNHSIARVSARQSCRLRAEPRKAELRVGRPRAQ